jgi:hypothetical protein
MQLIARIAVVPRLPIADNTGRFRAASATQANATSATSQVAVLAKALPLLAIAAMAPTAHASVTTLQAGAYSSTQVGIAAPDTVKYGPSDFSSDVLADPYVVSKSDSREDSGMSTVVDSSAAAAQFNGSAMADFFVRSVVSADAGAGPFQYPGHGAASSSATYDFAVTTASTLSFLFTASPSSATSFSNAYIALNLYSVGAHAYLTQGYVQGTQTVSYAVPAGIYNFTLVAFSEATIPANVASNFQVSSGATANLSLAISAVPEPASWALFSLGTAAMLAAGRRSRSARLNSAPRPS